MEVVSVTSKMTGRKPSTMSISIAFDAFSLRTPAQTV
jgi:hypothetical protein